MSAKFVFCLLSAFVAGAFAQNGKLNVADPTTTSSHCTIAGMFMSFMFANSAIRSLCIGAQPNDAQFERSRQLRLPSGWFQ